MPLNKSLERAGVEMINVENRNDGKGVGQPEDQEAPSYEEIADPEEIDVVAAGPAPSSSGDKNTAENPVDGDEVENPEKTVPASSEPETEPQSQRVLHPQRMKHLQVEKSSSIQSNRMKHYSGLR